jgi:2-phospho-L-lactate guanylyltransferase
MSIWSIIPVKALRESKSRLSRILSSRERAALTERLLKRTLRILDQSPIVHRSLVVSRDPAALKVARQLGALTFSESDDKDLDGALIRAAQLAAAQGARGVLVLPADLPLLAARDITAFLQGVVGSGVGVPFGRPSRQLVICPDYEHDGTNALFITPPVGYQFRYGPGSFQRHVDEAKRLGLSVDVVTVPGLRFDLDTEEDWRRYVAAQARETLPLVGSNGQEQPESLSEG